MDKYLQRTCDSEENIFWTIEALNECIGSLSYSVHRGNEKDIERYLRAVEKYGGEIFQACAMLLPDVYKASGGDEAALSRVRQYLQKVQAARDAERAEIQARADTWDKSSLQ